jgi:hypothetical protein
VFGEVRGVVSCSEGVFVFFETCGETTASLPYLSLSKVGACHLLDCECMSVSVLLVRKAIFKLVFLNKLVMKVVSFPMYVKVAHVAVGVCVGVIVNGFLSAVGVCGVGRGIGKALLCRMFWMVVTSAL